MIRCLKTTLTAVQVQKLKREACVSLPVFGTDREKTREFWHDVGDSYLVPRRYALKENLPGAKPDPALLNLTLTDALYYDGELFNTPARPQIAAVSAARHALERYFSTMFVLEPGVGKTNAAFKLVVELGVTCFFIVHNDKLAKQAEDRFRRLVKNKDPSKQVKIGRIRRDRCDTEGCDLVIVSFQSLAKRDYDPAKLRCGILIIDEVHHACAETWSKSIAKIQAYYVLGMTGTPVEGPLEKMSDMTIGPSCFTMRPQPNPNVEVNRIIFSTGRQVEIKDKRGKLRYSETVTALADDSMRIDLLVQLLRVLHAQYPERRCILFWSRVTPLVHIFNAIGNPEIAHLYTGGLDSDLPGWKVPSGKERPDVTCTRFLLLATYGTLGEGYDSNADLVIYGDPPPKQGRQAGARAGRELVMKHKATIIDIVDMFSVFIAMAKKRLKHNNMKRHKVFNVPAEKIFDQARRVPSFPRPRVPAAVIPIAVVPTEEHALHEEKDAEEDDDNDDDDVPQPQAPPSPPAAVKENEILPVFATPARTKRRETNAQDDDDDQPQPPTPIPATPRDEKQEDPEVAPVPPTFPASFAAPAPPPHDEKHDAVAAADVVLIPAPPPPSALDNKEAEEECMPSQPPSCVKLALPHATIIPQKPPPQTKRKRPVTASASHKKSKTEVQEKKIEDDDVFALLKRLKSCR